MANRYMKKYSRSLKVQDGYLLSKCQNKTSDSKDIKTREVLYTLGRNMRWYSHYGKTV
jgi:hypothetical protein